MRILFVNEYCGFLGGVEQNIAHVARALKVRGHHLSLLYSKASSKGSEDYQKLFDHTQQAPLDNLCSRVPALADSLRAETIYLHRIPDIEPFLSWPGHPRRVRMVHDHDLACPRRHKYYVWNQQICRHPAGWRCFADLAFIEKGPHGRPQYKSLQEFFRQLQLHQKLEALVVGSQFMLEELLQNRIPCERLHLLAPVVPTPTLELTPPSPEPAVLYVGQLIRGKGVDLLLRALALLKTPFRLDIIGDGNARPSLETLSRSLGLTGQVTFHGFVDPSGLAQAFRNCRLVAVPSRWPEPFGMTGLEAASYGRPVVGFASGGIPDWLEHGRTGYMAAEQDVPGLARALAGLLENHQLAEKMGREAHQRARLRFSFDLYIERLEECLRGAS